MYPESMLNKPKTKLSWILIAVVMYRCFLDLIFTQWISVYYGYYGFPYSFSLECYLASMLSTFIIAASLPRLLERKQFTDMVLVFLVFLYFLPAGSLCAFSKNDLGYFLFTQLYLFIMLIINRYNYVLPDFKIPLGDKVNWFEVIIVFLCLSMVLISGVYSGFRVTFNISEFYDYRVEVSNISMPSSVSYLFYWAMNIIPFGLAYAIVKKKKWMITLTLISDILAFSFNGKKSEFFLMFLVIGICLFYKGKYWKKLPVFMCGFAGVSIIENHLLKMNAFISHYFFRRMMFIPAYLGGAYYDFFSEYGFDYLRSSILRRFGFTSAYSGGIPSTIGYYLYHRATNANTGLCGDAFANFGWWSLLVYPLVIVLTYKVLEKCIGKIDERFEITLAFFVAYMFLSSSYFTILLTKGYILICVLMLVCPKENMENKD